MVSRIKQMSDWNNLQYKNMEKQKLKLNDEVTKFLDALNHPLRKEIEQLRVAILHSDKPLTENIKWKGPNYCFNNDDRITMKIQPPKVIHIIFHRGVKVRPQPKDKLITLIYNNSPSSKLSISFASVIQMLSNE